MKLKKSFLAEVAVFSLFSGLMTIAPANANFAVLLSVGSEAVTGATSSASPAEVYVPADNSVDAADALKVSITGLAQNTSVSVTGTDSLIVNSLSTSTRQVAANAGVAAASLNSGLSTFVEFYVYTTKSGLSSFRLDVSGTSNTYYLSGISGGAYNVSSNLSATAYTSTIYYDGVEVKVTDVFGNPVSGAEVKYTVIGATVVSCNCLTDSNGLTTLTINYPKNPGQAGVSFYINATPVIGMVKPVDIESTFVSVVDFLEEIAAAKAEINAELNAEISTLKDEVTALKAELANEKSEQALTMAVLEASESATAATDAANLAAEAADAATVAAEEARDAADAATAAIEELATQVSTLFATLRAQITTLGNTVAKIAKKVKA